MKLILFLILLFFITTNGKAQSWTSKMDSLARMTEAEWTMPHGTCKAFSLQESGYDTNAVRIETGYFNAGSKYAKAIETQSQLWVDTNSNKWKIPVSIERSQRSESFGLFQIMGENYRVLGFNENYIQPTIEEQFYYFGKFAGPEWKKLHNLAKLASWFNSGNPLKTGRAYDRNVTMYQKRFNK
jgi:hypothetical protein